MHTFWPGGTGRKALKSYIDFNRLRISSDFSTENYIFDILENYLILLGILVELSTVVSVLLRFDLENWGTPSVKFQKYLDENMKIIAPKMVCVRILCGDAKTKPEIAIITGQTVKMRNIWSVWVCLFLKNYFYVIRNATKTNNNYKKKKSFYKFIDFLVCSFDLTKKKQKQFCKSKLRISWNRLIIMEEQKPEK